MIYNPFSKDISNYLSTETSNSVEEYLKKNLSERQKKVIDFLDKIEAGDAKKIYKTMLFCQSYPDMPAIELVLSHCLNEFMNALLRRNESDRKVILEKAIEEMNFHGCNEKKLKEAASDAFVKIKEKLSDELFKIEGFVKLYLEVKYQEGAVIALARNIKNSKDFAHGLRHYKGNLTGNADEINNGISRIEDALISIGASYFDKLSGINKILEDANSYPFTRPSNDKIKNVLAVLTNESEIYFFNKLNNHEWFFLLKELLSPSSKNVEYDYFWPQGNYLARIAKHKSEEVFEIIKPYLENHLRKNDNVGNSILARIFKISENFPDDADYSLKVGEAYLSYLKNANDLNPIVNAYNIKDFLKNLAKRGHEDLVLQITENLLAMKPDSKEAKFNDFKTRFNDAANMDGYYFEEVLKVVKNSVLEKNSSKLFETLCAILKNAADGEFSKDSNQRLCYNRSAIEDHEQDKYRNAAEFKLITEIRDVAEYIFENDPNNSSKVIGILEEKLSNGSDFLIFTRMILHLLRKYPEQQDSAIARHLVIKERFDDYKIHHEYYLLMKREFKNLSNTNKNKILGFVNDGFKERKNTKVQDNDKAKEDRDAYAKRWLFDELDCINEGLSGEWKKKYQELSKDFKKQERPDLLHYVEEATMVTDLSPISEDELAKMKLEEIVKFIASWQPKEGAFFNEPNPKGLGDALEKDFEKNPKKYLSGLELFKQVSNPTYSKRLLRAFKKYPNKTAADWKKIIDLGDWISKQSIEIKSENLSSYDFDGDKHWGWCKQEFAKLVSESCKSKEEDKNKIPENLFKDVTKILEKIIFDKDAILESWKIDDNDEDRYYSRAINSSYGEALSAMIEFSLWLYRKNNKDLASKFLTPVLDKVIAEGIYLEGWAVLGRYFPWIMLIDRNWIDKNLDKIFPENDNTRFEVSWLTYLHFVPSFDEAFEVLKKKYLYALKNQKERKDRSNLRLGESIAVFYARKKIDLDDEILIKLFERKSLKEGSAMMSLIGRICCNQDNIPSQEVIARFKDLWNWRVGNSKIMPISVKEYESFKWWYKSGLFDRKWALEQLLEAEKNFGDKRRSEIFIIGERLFEDLQDYPKTAWKVIELMLKVEGYFMNVDIDFTKQVFGLIEKSDWNEIKKEAGEVKDEFCRRHRLDENFVSLHP